MTVVYGSQLDVQEVMVLEASVSPKTSECVISKIALEITPIRLPLPFVSFIINWKGIPLERNLFFFSTSAAVEGAQISHNCFKACFQF